MSNENNESLLAIREENFLVKRLLNALPEEFAGLINHLVDGGSGRVATGSAVKDMGLAAIKHRLLTPGAAEVLIAEIQNYGGFAAANLFRRKGIPYSELLMDTLDYLGHEGPRDKQVHLLENTLLRQQFKLLWDKETASGQETLAKHLGTAPELNNLLTTLETQEGRLRFAEYLCGKDVDQSLLHSESKVIESAATIHGGVTAGPAGAGLGKLIGMGLNHIMPDVVKATLGSAISSHRVTLPCINYLILMRLRQEHQTDKTPSSASTHPLQHPTEIPVGDALVVKDEQDNHVISVMQAELSSIPSHATRLDSQKTGISRLSPLMQAAPTAMLGNAINDETIMKVVINGPLSIARDKAGNVIEGANRAMSHGPKGIKEHALLYQVDVASMVTPAAMYQLASLALAQKHLADISAKLDDIKEGIDRIANFQKNERRSRTEGKIRYFQQIAASILKGERSSSVENNLEKAEDDLLLVQSHIEADLDAILSDIRHAKDDGKFGMSSFREKIHRLQNDFNEVSEEWKVCISARMIACRLLCNFENTHNRIEDREKSIRNDVERMLGKGGRFDTIESAIEAHLSKFSAIGDSRIELQANREILQIARQAALPALRTDTRNIATSFETMLLENHNPVELLVKVRDSEVFEAAVL